MPANYGKRHKIGIDSEDIVLETIRGNLWLL
jgi:hypothetical protein